jgi:hypothetical protein
MRYVRGVLVYEYKYFFVKPSSSFPLKDVDDYFVNRCNLYQNNNSNYVIGSLFNARDMLQVVYFSDYTRDSHSMDTNVINITNNNNNSEIVSEPRTPMEVVNSLIMPTGGFNSILTTSQPVKGIVYD